ncbi:MAG: cysteine desulfurase [Oscillospiraceae bacterium]|nr:cysteine desulfurase [Oscillospiraceae bacterium]
MTVYFDYAATTPVLPEAARAAWQVMTEDFGNPSSGYGLGVQAAAALKGWRADAARAVGCEPEELFFTSGGTEGDNWAVFGAARAMERRGRHIVTTAVEHAAVLEPVRRLEERGFRVTYLRPDRAGRISPEDFAAALEEDTVLVSMMLVNNELGTLLPVARCARIAKQRRRDILFHTDAVQALGHVPLSARELGVDLLTVSGHKIGAPKGVGALYVKKSVQGRFPPLLLGGGQEGGRRSGTEATAQIAAFAAACRASAGRLGQMEAVAALKDYTLERLQAQVPGLTVVSRGDAPHICAVSLPGYPSQMVMNDLDSRGFCVSNGSACHRGKPSHVYAALNLPAPVRRGALRLSFAPESTREQADGLAQAMKEIAAQRLPEMK